MAGTNYNPNILRQHSKPPSYPRSAQSYPSTNHTNHEHQNPQQYSKNVQYSTMHVYENIHHRYRHSDGYHYPLISPSSSSHTSNRTGQSNDNWNGHPNSALNNNNQQGLVLNGDPFSYQRTPYHQLESADSTTQNSKESLSVPGEGTDDSSDIVTVAGKHVKLKSPEVRIGLLGVVLVVLAACFLVISSVVSADPWNNMRGYMITGLVLLGVGVVLILANLIWCGHVERNLARALVGRSSRHNNDAARPESQNTISTDLRTLDSEQNNNTQGSEEWVTVPVKTKALSMGVTVPKPAQNTFKQNLNIYSSYPRNGFENFAYEQENRKEGRTSGYATASTTLSSANTLDTGFVQPEVNRDLHPKMQNSEPFSPTKRKKSRKKKAVEYPRTSTRKDLSDPTDTDSAPENVNASALRQRLQKDPRLTGSGYFPAARLNSQGGRFEFAGPIRSQSVPGDEREALRRQRSEIGDGLLYTDTKPNQNPRSKSHDPTRLSEQYPHAKVPMDGLLHVAKKSYSNFVDDYGDDVHTPQKVVVNNASNHLKNQYKVQRTDFEMKNSANNGRMSRWDRTYSQNGGPGPQNFYVNGGVGENNTKNYKDTINARQRSNTDSGIIDIGTSVDDNVFESQENVQFGAKRSLYLNGFAPAINNDPRGRYGQKPSVQDQEYYNTHGHYLKKPSIDSTLQTYI